jgi:hypothetical protein
MGFVTMKPTPQDVPMMVVIAAESVPTQNFAPHVYAMQKLKQQLTTLVSSISAFLCLDFVF